jgi:hypothetical protein
MNRIVGSLFAFQRLGCQPVAQISNLPFRRVPLGRPADYRPSLGCWATPSGLEIGETADWKSALRPTGSREDVLTEALELPEVQTRNG